MSNDDKKSLETEPVAVDNMGGPILAIPGSTSGCSTEKRTLPLLYVQPSITKCNTSDSGSETVIPISVPKLGTPVTVPSVSNGVTAGAKFVQVQTPNQNIAYSGYIGTLFKQSNKGKDPIKQKVLLTPVKGKEVSMARLILPRPTTPSPQGMIPGKKICRSFVVPVTQTSLIKPNDSMAGRLIQPNIIRPRGVEGKILTNAIIKPANIKGTVSPGLTLVKGPQLQTQIQSGDKTPMKVILVDMKEDKTNKADIKSAEPTISKVIKTVNLEDSSNNDNTISDIVTIEDDKDKCDKAPTKPMETESDKSVKIKSESDKTTVDKKSMQWDEKETNSSSLQSTENRARKRKGSLLSSVNGTPKKVLVGDPYENVKLFPGAEEYDPFSIIDWDSQGLGSLPSSTIKVVKNEFDMVELLEGIEQTDKKKPDEIFCCLSCRCYGLISEFYNENYCSIGCRDELIAQQHSIFSKKDSDIETAEPNDKAKNLENGPIKLAAISNETKFASKISEKVINSAGNEVSLLKSNESDIIDLVNDNSSAESESPVKKPLNNETRFMKMKKIITKGYKITRKSDLIKPLTPQSSEETDSKTKIKLRPRTPCNKISKSPLSEDIVAQDLDMGPSSIDLEVTKKKSPVRFRWNTYLSETKASAAWVKLFNNPFPSRPNRFKVGHRLEAVDPEHQSHICLVSVAEVRGYRLRLHFDGYPKEYDFWVNADNPYLFPSEFCFKHKIPLQLPPGLGIKQFDWESYLSRINAKCAPESCFESNSSHPDLVNLFKVDMKLEAVDRKNTYLVCVATVAAVMENRILIHFDSWDDMYDYWVDITSPYIRPVGWCKSAGHELTPPNGIKPEDFSWKKYLRDTRSVAAPEKAFVLRPPIEFKKGMKIEAVDKRAPHLVRVATISEVLPYQVKITFDGFPAHFGYWVDDDCPDIHPVGWSSRAGHPLEPPPTADDFINSLCPTPGCVGQGYYQGIKREVHKLPKNCPYTTDNLVKDPTLSDRLKWGSKQCRRSLDDVINLTEGSAEESEDEPEERKWAWIKVMQEHKKEVNREKGPENIVNYKPDSETELDHSQAEIPEANDEKKDSSLETNNEIAEIKEEANEQSSIDFPVKLENDPDPVVVQSNDECSNKVCSVEEVNPPIIERIKEEEDDSNISIEDATSKKDTEGEKSLGTPEPNAENMDIDAAIDKEIKTEKESTEVEQNDFEQNNPLYWSIHQVSKFTRPLISSPKDCFLEEQIDGQGLLMLQKSDLLDCLGLSDSDAERVYTRINMLRQKAV